MSGGTVLALQVAPATTSGTTFDEALDVTLDGHQLADVEELATAHGGRIHVVRTRGGTLEIDYRASIRPLPVVPLGTPIGNRLTIDAEAIAAQRQSRYVPSDALGNFAAAEFAGWAQGPDLARAVAEWVFERLAYEPGSSGPLDTAVDTLLAGVGACRDFAHLTIALCRAMGVPARMVAVYAPGLLPMDFHAVAEARRGSQWEVLDATRLAPRQSLTRIATGRDAADTAFAATLEGRAEMADIEVTTVVDGDLPADDHRTPVALA